LFSLLATVGARGTESGRHIGLAALSPEHGTIHTFIIKQNLRLLHEEGPFPSLLAVVSVRNSDEKASSGGKT